MQLPIVIHWTQVICSVVHKNNSHYHQFSTFHQIEKLLKGNERWRWCMCELERRLTDFYLFVSLFFGPLQSFPWFFVTQGLALKICDPQWWTVFHTCVGYMLHSAVKCLFIVSCPFFWPCSDCVCMCVLLLYMLLIIVHYKLCVLWTLFASL